MGAGHGYGQEKIANVFRYNYSVGHIVDGCGIRKESVQMDSSGLSFVVGMRVKRVMACRNSVAMDRAPIGRRFRVVSGEEIHPLKTSSFPDIYLTGEVVIVRIFICRITPFLDSLAEAFREFLIVGGEPKQSFCVFPQTFGELVPPFPGSGRGRG